MIKIRPNEMVLKGNWKFNETSVQLDDVGERIESLISFYLIEISVDESGWKKLYQDPEDKRYWELSYPESEIHGGGAPMLKNLSLQQAKMKYQI